MTIRVLWLIKGLGPGGAEHLLLNQAKVANFTDFDVEVAFTNFGKQHLVPDLNAVGVHTTCLGEGIRALWPLRLWKLLRRGQFDVVHVHSPLLAAVTRLLARLHRRRPALVSTEHNSWAAYSFITRWLNAATFLLDDAHIAVSANAQSSIPARYRSHVRVIHHGVAATELRRQTPDRTRKRAELGVAPDDVVVVTVANFRVHKDYPNLIAAAQLAIAGSPSVRFLAVGQGPLETEVAALLQGSDLGHRFRLLGYRADARDVIAAADIFVLASRQEGLPVALMEALVLGRAVAVTAAGGITEMVKDRREGRVVPIEDAEALANALVELAENDSFREECAERSRQRGDDFDIARAEEEIEELYRGLVDDADR